MKKLDLNEYMAKPQFAAVSTSPKLAEKIGHLSGQRPSDVTVWNWSRRGMVPTNKVWLKTLAFIFKVPHGEQFFLS